MLTEPRIIGIIGGKGRIGSRFAGAFRKEGYKVLVSDLNTKLSNIDVVRKADFIILSVPIRQVEKVIKEISPYLSNDVVLTDFTSVKLMPLEFMRKYCKCNFFGGHPMFGPKTDFDDQNFVLCPGRGCKYLSWYKNFLKTIGLNLIMLSAREHDKCSSFIQFLTHSSSLLLAFSIKKAGFNLKLAKKIKTPIFDLNLDIIKRVLDQDPKLTSDMAVENPFNLKFLKTYLESPDELNKIIKEKDKIGYENKLLNCRNYFKEV